MGGGQKQCYQQKSARPPLIGFVPSRIYWHYGTRPLSLRIYEIKTGAGKLCLFPSRDEKRPVRPEPPSKICYSRIQVRPQWGGKTLAEGNVAGDGLAHSESI